ncbi:histidine phosphatase family protein [Waterburya agarophytonicola K14]|uniref:Histidine phosphatase family protein n=1 Tax=Waterburya agarophytonicola KI4 TaxID=2874699 RepID=A0A964BME5_9CYAN|nr:histidine phosphatase family protein [Waterburya agarophytonicola]MCC0176028.1 histidine phosphatase family protein [Waterburya agarophytonicola KI4]
MTTRVIIVRHGQSTYNAQKIIQGRCDESVLTDQGIADAQQVGQALSSLSIDAFYCSPLQRAKQTAQTIHALLDNPPPLQSTEQLMEIDLPLWQKLKKDEVANKFAAAYRQWKENPQSFKMTLADGTEHYPVPALYEQAQNFWQDTIAKHSGQTILIVAHNGINRCLIMSAIAMSSDRYHSIQQSNCCISILNFTGEFGEPVQLESLNQTSHLGIPIPPTRPCHSGPRLIMVRHGETNWNKESRFQGIKDIPLNENGRSQGRKAGTFLQDIPIDFAISSSMLRPKETAEIILQHHPDVALSTTPELIEICHGLWEGMLEAEIQADYPELLQQWKDKPETVQMPEGENLQQVWDRGVAAWNKIAEDHSNNDSSLTGLVVAHDAINKVILCYLLGLKPDNFWNIKQGNCAVSVIDYPNGASDKPVLQAINITTHLGGGSIIDKTAAGAL